MVRSLKIISILLCLCAVSEISICQCIAVAGAEVALCKPEHFEVEIGGAPTATGGFPPYKYHWTLLKNYSGPGSILAILNNDTIPNPTAKFYYDVILLLTVTDSLSNTCKDTIGIHKNQRQSSNFHNTDHFWLGDSIQLSTIYSLSSIGPPPLTYAWSPSIWLTDSTELRTYAKPERSIKYYLRITNGFGCVFKDDYDLTYLGPRQSSTPIVEQLKQGIHYNALTQQLRIYDSTGMQKFHLELYDMNGKLVLNEDLLMASPLLLKDLAAGVYYARATSYSTSQNYLQKFFKY